VDGVVAGFINSGAAFEVEMSDEAFKELIGHDPAGPHVVIMSVVVHPDYRAGTGQAFDGRVHRAHARTGQGQHQPDVQGAAYPLYAGFGFAYVKPSASDHGGMAWHEMVLSL
jgi:hypothetical protein